MINPINVMVGDKVEGFTFQNVNTRYLERMISDFQEYIVRCDNKRDQEWRCAEELVDRVTNEVKHLIDYSDILAVSSLCNISDILVKPWIRGRLGGLDATIDEKYSGWIATVYQKADPQTQLFSDDERFTIAHECGHTLFYYPGWLRNRIRTGIRVTPSRAFSRGDPLYEREEEIADHFAKSLGYNNSECLY